MTTSEFSCKYQKWMDFIIFGHAWTFRDNFNLWIIVIFNVFPGGYIWIRLYGTFASVLMVSLQSRIAPVACEHCNTYLMEGSNGGHSPVTWASGHNDPEPRLLQQF